MPEAGGVSNWKVTNMQKGRTRKSHRKKMLWVSTGNNGQIPSWFSDVSYPPLTSHGTEKTEKQCRWIHLSREQWKPITTRPDQPPARSAPSLLPTRPQTCSAQLHSHWIPSYLEESSLLTAAPARRAKYGEVFNILLADVMPSLSSIRGCSELCLVCLPEAPAALLIHK